MLVLFYMFGVTVKCAKVIIMLLLFYLLLLLQFEQVSFGQ